MPPFYRKPPTHPQSPNPHIQASHPLTITAAPSGAKMVAADYIATRSDGFEATKPSHPHTPPLCIFICPPPPPRQSHASTGLRGTARQSRADPHPDFKKKIESSDSSFVLTLPRPTRVFPSWAGRWGKQKRESADSSFVLPHRPPQLGQ